MFSHYGKLRVLFKKDIHSPEGSFPVLNSYTVSTCLVVHERLRVQDSFFSYYEHCGNEGVRLSYPSRDQTNSENAMKLRVFTVKFETFVYPQFCRQDSDLVSSLSLSKSSRFLCLPRLIHCLTTFTKVFFSQRPKKSSFGDAHHTEGG